MRVVLCVCLCVLLVNSVFARVAIQDDKLEVISNTIEDSKDNVIVYISVNENKKTCEHANKTEKGSRETVDRNKIDELDISNNLIDSNEVDCSEVEDNGTALLLSTFIEAGKIEEARNASKVPLELFLGVESYTGFLTVNQTYNSNIFFWYFPIEGKPVNETPWLIWLQGGPGASSLTGLFDEIGPFTVDKNGVLKKNPYTWHANHSLLFIDNPVGTGYSFTDSNLGITRDMETYSKHLYSAVEQFLQIFPELRTAPLYVAGESYGGKYVPCLATELHNHKTSSALEINLQGIIVGNGYIEPSMISNLPRTFYNFGIIEKEQLDLLKPLHESIMSEISANRSVEAKDKWSTLIIALLSISHQKHAYNFLKDDLQIGNYAKYFLIRPDVKKAIHVGDIHFNLINVTVNTQLAPDFLSSTQHLYENLLENYRILLYCGQLDQMLPCVTASESHRRWRWSRQEEFSRAMRFPFTYDEKLAGYYKTGGGFTEAVVRGAGHMAPLDVPGPTQALVTRWTHRLYMKPILQAFFRFTFSKTNTNNTTSIVYL